MKVLHIYSIWYLFSTEVTYLSDLLTVPAVVVYCGDVSASSEQQRDHGHVVRTGR